jgi:hypothetical protein
MSNRRHRHASVEAEPGKPEGNAKSKAPIEQRSGAHMVTSYASKMSLVSFDSLTGTAARYVSCRIQSVDIYTGMTVTGCA